MLNFVFETGTEEGRERQRERKTEQRETEKEKREKEIGEEEEGRRKRPSAGMSIPEDKPFLKYLEMMQHLFIKTYIHAFEFGDGEHFMKINTNSLSEKKMLKFINKEEEKEKMLCSRRDFVYFFLICTLGLI